MTFANNSTAILPTEPSLTIYPLPWSYGQIVLSLLGMFGNANIIVATVRGKNLKNACNYLIAINAAFDFYTEIGFLQESMYVLLHEWTMRNDICFQRLSHMIFAINVSAFLIWTIGMDRLFAIKFALRYHQWHTKTYIALMVLPAILYSAVLTAIGFACSSPDEIVPLCMVPTAFRGLSSDLWVYTGVIINILVVVTYGWVYILARKQAQSQETSRRVGEGANDHMRRLIESLLIIMIIYILGWLITMTVILVVSNTGMSVTIVFHSALYVGWNAAISVGCNYYIYFMRSNEYAQLFRQQLCCLPKSGVGSGQSKASTTATAKRAWTLPSDRN